MVLYPIVKIRMRKFEFGGINQLRCINNTNSKYMKNEGFKNIKITEFKIFHIVKLHLKHFI